MSFILGEYFLAINFDVNFWKLNIDDFLVKGALSFYNFYGGRLFTITKTCLFSQSICSATGIFARAITVYHM